MMKKQFIFFLLFLTGCGTVFESDSQQALTAYVIRQNAIAEAKRKEEEINDAVRKFQVEAVRLGFAYWDVDQYGKVKFTWLTGRNK